MERPSTKIRAELESIQRRIPTLKDELLRASIRETPPVVQDHAYWLSIYPNGNFPLGALE